VLFISSIALGWGALPSELIATWEKSGREKTSVTRRDRIFVVIAVILVKKQLMC